MNLVETILKIQKEENRVLSWGEKDLIARAWNAALDPCAPFTPCKDIKICQVDKDECCYEGRLPHCFKAD